MSHDTVWIPSVPLPFLGFRSNRCVSCGAKFTGTNRGHDYELHWRREHEKDDPVASAVLMEVTRDEAVRIYEEVAR